VNGVNIDKTPPLINAVTIPAPNANGWNNTDVTVSFNVSDLLSGIASSSSPVTLTNEGAAQVVIGTATDRAGNTSSVNVAINIDKTAPEAFIQFDPATKNVLVFGRDSLSGVSPSAVSPFLVTPPDGHKGNGDDDDDDGRMEQRTYRILDRAGNIVTLVLKVKAEGHELKAKVISLQYNSGPVLTPQKNKLKYDWDTDRHGVLKELEQELKDDSGSPEEVEADFRADKNQTVIKTKHPNSTVIRSGLVLVRLASDHGQLRIEF
jgi:hypothetical protein